ncbi:MAG TPA: circularly permuted type 2 ATP-grasp protein, partial [Solirubrobacteraceae bacterium]|nr:circularly permuted type 2 ATP-grasp protein [Solirubrobacteraceae bacterium]
MAFEPFPEHPLDEERASNGSIRPVYAATLDALAQADLAGLVTGAAQHLADDGVTFGSAPFVVDPVPRLIEAAEWEPLERGLAQRTRALNSFLLDAYAQRRIVDAGLIAEEVITGAEGYEPDLAGRLPDRTPPAAIIGFDLVRAPDGQFLVLEDNLRTPSGLAYLLAARDALQATLPPGLPQPRPIDPAIYELLAATLRSAGAHRDDRQRQVVVVTDGPDNVAYYEHARLADGLGAPLVTPDDLALDGDRLTVRLPEDTVRRVDVVYRRTDEDRVRDENGDMTPIAELLMPAWTAGEIGLINAFGNGVADDKLVHAHVEDFIRFYLGEEPLVRSVPTLAVESLGLGDAAVTRLRELVIKPRHGHGGTGVTIGSKATTAELAEVAAELERNPEQYIAQPIVPLSRHPTVIEGRLQPRHLDLRPFAFC